MTERLSPPEAGAMGALALRIGSERVAGEGSLPLHDRHTGAHLGDVACAGAAQVDAAVTAARHALESSKLSPQDRYRILTGAAEWIERHRTRILTAIVAESGFTVTDATGEVNRCIQTLTLSAEEAKRLTGEMVPIEAAPGQTHRMGYTIRVPVGVVAAITPFNSPLNTVAHKVAPALAGGNTVVLKPASYTPWTAALLCDALEEAGLPAGHLNLVLGSGGETGQALVEHHGVSFFAFTGSTEVGRTIRREAGLRRTSLELGSISGTIVCEDADLEDAADKCFRAGFRKAGQVCTSVQRLYVHEEVLERFTELLVGAVKEAKVGDPYDASTVVGPMISEGEAERATAWVADAVGAGAELLAGGSRRGALMEPTLLTGVDPAMRVMCEEIFAPVISIVPYASFDAAIDSLNDTPYGLAAGVFTKDLARAIEASHRLHVGGVHINQTSSSRVNLMPYGGAKDSGTGREGPHYAVREMTEERLVTMTWGKT